jgi:hypothetical protein
MDEEDYRNDIATIPTISYDGYYWVGKDYANTYKKDFQNVEDFGLGKEYNFIFKTEI